MQPLPARGAIVDLETIGRICTHFGLTELWDRIDRDPPPKPFASDGCSCWFDSWQGVDLYPACFLHDLAYWAGYPDGSKAEAVERLIADARLMTTVATLTGDTLLAEIMFHGIRVGGHELFKQSFSWGFGRM